MSYPVYNGQINTMILGNKKLGGAKSLPFYEKGHVPKYAYAVADSLNKELPQALQKELGPVINNPVEWVKIYNDDADAICLQIFSIDPNGQNANIVQALDTIGQVIEATSLPLIIWGCNDIQKDKELFLAIIKKYKTHLYAIGPVQQEHHKEIAAAYKDSDIKIIASTPVDVNMAKQLNIMLENEGIDKENILIDPVVSVIGYGIEYVYSVIERIRLAALAHNDDKLSKPIVCNIGFESWKIKESGYMDEIKMGDNNMRGIMWEATSAAMLATAGADLIIMLSPKAKKLAQKLTNNLSNTYNEF